MVRVEAHPLELSSSCREELKREVISAFPGSLVDEKSTRRVGSLSHLFISRHVSKFLMVPPDHNYPSHPLTLYLPHLLRDKDIVSSRCFEDRWN